MDGPLLPGRSYDRAGQLGEGSFGAVLTVYETDTGIEYAAKRFELNEDDGCTMSTGAIIEVSYLSAIKSTNIKGIIHLEDICELTEEGENILCAVLPKYKCNLEDAIKGGALTSNRVRLTIALTILETLSILHDNGVVHRDIKSANIMLTDDLIPILIDFSLAKYMPNGNDEANPSLNNITNDNKHTGSVGTPTYMAPELVEANGDAMSYDSRVDSWSIGVVLLELFTGKVIEECKDKAAFKMIADTKSRMSDKPVPSIIKALLEIEPSSRITCKEAYVRLIDCSNDKENKQHQLTEKCSKRIVNCFGNYIVEATKTKETASDLEVLKEIRRFYDLLEMTNPTTIKAAMYFNSLFQNTIHNGSSTPPPPLPLHLILLAQKIYEPQSLGSKEEDGILGRRKELMVDLVTIDEFDDNDPDLQDFDIDEYMADEINIMRAANWCCLVIPVASKEEGDSLIGNSVMIRRGKHKRIKGKRKRKEEKQAEKRKQRRMQNAAADDGGSDDDSDWYE